MHLVTAASALCLIRVTGHLRRRASKAFFASSPQQTVTSRDTIGNVAVGVLVSLVMNSVLGLGQF
jgi:hypothetical protein